MKLTSYKKDGMLLREEFKLKGLFSYLRCFHSLAQKRHDDTSPGTENELEDVPRVLGPLELNLPNSDTLWVSNPRPDHSASYYNFSLFTFSLNDLRPEMKKILCPTDCRLRPDIRKLEEGDLSRASALKHSLEEKQRESRKKRARFGKEADPEALWFKLGRNPHTKEEDWVFTEQYWERDFSKCPDIF
ncbi:unnamed protein product [Darwinula stevensoni]|uniref:Uncharacterized protein n=1 Tax=Darwinula stevensoni TaxID=69355 RepID=A0A7R9FSI9_9CRUS|nr:unnamed protein product [Darwinula stevensoni]CAG0903311.1 unnamed protein product [Darwinula stevensoni]